MENLFEFIAKNNLSNDLNLYYGGWEKCKCSHSFGPSTRQHYLLHYIIDGKGTYSTNGKTYHLKKGDGFLILPFQSTYYKADNTNPWHYCWISFDGHEAKNILQKCGLDENNLIFRPKNSDEFQFNLLNLVNSYKNNVDNELLLLAQLYLCFSSLYECTENKYPILEIDYCQAAIDYIYSNYCFDIKISDIAKYIGIDRTYLYKLFIEKYNISPQQYLIQFRLNAAVNLLCSTDMSITEIAYSCGFINQAIFYKHFKKHFNTTPSNHRKNHSNFFVKK